jgi:hypothetical protein
MRISAEVFTESIAKIAKLSGDGDMQAFGDRFVTWPTSCSVYRVHARRRGLPMSMLGTNDLYRAILEDAEVARAFDLDSDGERDLMSTYLRESELGGSGQVRIVSMHGESSGASHILATLGMGGAFHR